MGNLADKRRLRKEAGEKIYKGDSVISEKDEMMYIPFVQSGNPDEERPWLYKGYYDMPDKGSINMDMKRMDGYVELTVSCVEDYKDYVGEAVEKFITKCFEQSPHEVKTISVEEHDSEMDLLKKEVVRLQIERDNAKEAVEQFKKVMESIE